MAIILVISSIVGSGIFKKAAPMAEYLHEPWLVILAWLLSGMIVMFGILSIAELSALFPTSGGPFFWLEKMYGRLISFLYGWSCFTVIQTAAIASDRKSTRLNSSHVKISYAVFCLKKNSIRRLRYL